MVEMSRGGSPTTMVGDNLRICGRCHKVLPISEFQVWIDNRGRVPIKRFNSYCKKCKREHHQELYTEHMSDPSYREKIRKWGRNQYHRIRERIKVDEEFAKKTQAQRHRYYLKRKRRKNNNG